MGGIGNPTYLAYKRLPLYSFISRI
jgi:hypothetical protein